MTQEQRQNYEKIYKLVIDLQKKYWPYKGEIDKNQAFGQVINFAQSSLRISLDPTKRNFLQEVAETIIEELSKPPEQEAPSIPANLQDFVKEMDEVRAKEEARREKLMSKGSQETLSRLLNLNQKIIAQNYPHLTKGVTNKVSRELTEDIINRIPPAAREDLSKPEDLRKAIDKNFIAEKLKNVGLEPKEGVSQKLLRDADVAKTIKKIAAEPEIIQSVKETTQKETIVPSQIPSLSKEVLVKLNQPPEEVNFLPLYTVLHPKVAAAFIEKAIYTLPAKFLSLTAEDASPEWRAMMQKGLFVEDIQTSIKALKAMGVPENHLLLKNLSDKAARLQEQQKFTIQTKDGQIISKDTLAARIFKHYFHFDKITNRKKIHDEDLKENLPRLSPDLVWSQGGYADFLRNNLNRFKFVINTYERFSKFVTKGKYTSFLTPVRQFFSQKVTQPVIKWLAKTAAGKVVKQGAKKAATWIAAKLGMKLAVMAGVAAAGAATGPPGWVVAAVTIGLDILKTLGRKVIGFIRRIIQEPDKALGSVAVGVLLLVFIPTPLKLIAILPLAVGGLGLMTFIAAPVTLGAIGGGIGAFFTAIAAIPIAVPIALFVIILFSALAGLTLFIVLVVSGAFILPSKVAEVTPTTISPYESEYFTITKTASPNQLDNPVLQTYPQIEYTVSIVAKNDYKLTIKSITENVSLIYDQQSGKQLSANPHSFEKDLDEIEHINVASWETKYIISLFPGFENTAIINTITAEITVEGISGAFPAIASAVVIIGTPPGDCPLIWPTPFGYIGQGPDTHGINATHYRQYKEEAIDIMVPNGTKVVATHQGTVVATLCDDVPGSDVAGGYVVKISGVCQGIPFTSWYMHMQNFSVKAGDRVTPGQQIGFSDSTSGGCPGATEHNTAQHLHYEFRTQPNEDSKIKMVFPNIPVTVPRGCLGRADCGNISW